MTNIPYLNGKILINYHQVAELLNLYEAFETDFDRDRRIKVLYRNEEYPEGIPLHEAFAAFAQKMIDKAKTEPILKAEEAAV